MKIWHRRRPMCHYESYAPGMGANAASRRGRAKRNRFHARKLLPAYKKLRGTLSDGLKPMFFR